MKRLLYFLICISIIYACETDDDCSGHGSCQNYKCYCEWFYQGETCSERWVDNNPGWFDFYIFYCIYTCLINLAIVALAIHQLKLSFPKIKINMVNLIMILYVLAAMCKTFEQ